MSVYLHVETTLDWNIIMLYIIEQKSYCSDGHCAIDEQIWSFARSMTHTRVLIISP